jgi:ribosomal-protein-serine acetyltransferase
MTVIQIDDQIYLRPFRMEDADLVFRTARENFEHLRSYMHWMVPDYSLRSAQEFIAASLAAANEKKSLGFGIFKEEHLLGSIGFVKFDWTAKSTEIGYWIAKSEEGKGLISKACETLINYALRELGINRIEIRCASENTRSAAVARRLGFQKEGVLRQSEWRDGRLHDFDIYGLLASEWKPTAD